MLVLWMALAHGAVPADIADAARVGDCAHVVAGLQRPQGDDQRLLVGWCLVHTGKPQEGLGTLAPVTTGVLGDYARWTKARAEVDLGRPEDATKTLVGLKLPGAQGMQVRLLRAEALVKTKRSLVARDDLRLLTGTAVADEARFWLARGALDRGDPAAATPVLETLWAESVRGPWSDQAADLLEAQGWSMPDLATAPGRQLALRRVSALRDANRHVEALALLDALRAVVPATTPADWLQLARTRFAAKQYPLAIAAYQSALGAPPTADGTPADLFNYALATARTGDHPTAGVIYTRIFTLHPTTPEADFASFKIGYMAYDRGDLAAARGELAAHIARRPDSPRLGEALWFSARSAWRLGDRKTAVSELDQLMLRAPRSDLVPAAAYWKARSSGLDGDAAGEKAGYEEVLSRWPSSGYAWFAALRLGKTFEKHAAVPRPAWPPELAHDAAVQRSETLLSMGLGAWASAELEPVLGHLGGTKESAMAAAYALIAAGDYQDAQRLAHPYCGPPARGGDAVAQQACYPRPEATIVSSTAAKYGLDPLLPYGIMNAESGLDPTVTSVAGARGLMQLMPDLARGVHEELYGESPYDPDNLYRPGYNAALGTAELGRTRKQLGDILGGTSTPAVVASYNGGEEAVRRWVQAWPQKPDFDEFSEDVGYTETRQYVRRVLGYEMQYRWVYGD
jgi:soluble lytic murein transglycosylase